MKHVKRFASVCLALAMAVTMAIGALAANNGSITVDNPKKDQTYTAYKIFDAEVNATTGTYRYTISKTSEWFSVIASESEGTVTSKIAGLKLEEDENTGTYVVTQGAEATNKFSAADFAATLKAALATMNPAPTGNKLEAQSGGKPTASDLDLGYYFVTSTSGALCNLTTTNPDVTIKDKNDVPFKKEVDETSVEIGQVVHYTLTSTVPDTTGLTSGKYTFTDKMSEGLTFNNDVKVTVGGTELTNAQYTLKTGTAAGENDFELVLDVTKLTTGAEIKITYSATVNDKAIAKIEENTATLTYSNDPNNTITVKEEVYSAKIVIDKYEEGNNNKKLKDAKFVLMNSTKNKYYKYTEATNGAKAKVVWVDNQSDATVVTTDVNGAAQFIGLKDGTYYLKETVAPSGYNLLSDPVTITINGKNATTADLSSLTVKEEIANNTGSQLPTTGGMGTTILYTIGGILVIGAGVLLVVKRRMNAEK